MHQALRSSVRQRMKCIDYISYSAAQYTFAHLSLALWRTRESRWATKGWVSGQSLVNRAVSPSGATSSVTQLMWREMLLIFRSWEYFSVEE